MRFISFAAGALLALATPALAFDDSDRAAVTKKFDALIQDLRDKDYGAVLAVLPPPLLESIRASTGLDDAGFRQVMQEQMSGVMADVEIKELGYDAAAMTSGTSSEGRDYAVVPSKTVMGMAGQTITTLSPILALEDGGEWYLILVQSGDDLAQVAAVYPDLAEVDLPEPQVTVE